MGHQVAYLSAEKNNLSSTHQQLLFFLICWFPRLLTALGQSTPNACSIRLRILRQNPGSAGEEQIPSAPRIEASKVHVLFYS